MSKKPDTASRILDLLTILSMNTRGPVGWAGGLASFDVAERLDVPITTVRYHLRRMSDQGIVTAFAPRWYQRLDGRTANTLVWFRLEKNKSV